MIPAVIWKTDDISDSTSDPASMKNRRTTQDGGFVTPDFHAMVSGRVIVLKRQSPRGWSENRLMVEEAVTSGSGL